MIFYNKMKYLLIVESPNKIKTLTDILKNEKDEYKIIASAGHILELDSKSGTNNMGFDIENNFEPHYINIKDKQKIISNIKKTYKDFKPDKVLLGGDIDFEGTFINWSIKTILKLKDDDYKTVEFIALTKEDVLNALKKDTKINQFHLQAQQTRCILDKLCGFTLSPRLMKALGNNLSAGRVQSIVVKLIIDKENEINEFLNNGDNNYYSINGNFIINNDLIINGNYKNQDNNIINKLNNFQINPYFINNKKFNTIEIKPPKPYNTPSLQQDINKKFGLSSKSSMKILQSLFEKGYITYHRTTSISLSDECNNLCKEFIINNFGNEYYQLRIYNDINNNSENSHEAIRHTNNNNNNLNNLNDLEKKIYLLIMNNTIKSQMKNKIINEIILKFSNNNIDDNFKAIFKKVIFKGFSIIDNNNEDDENKLFDIINNININDKLIMKDIKFTEKYNNPPSRFTEASLINKLSPKNLNIGRPSTYASIIDKIQKRNYVKIDDIKGKTKNTINYIITPNNITKENDTFNIGEEKKKFIPTELGINVNNLLNKNCKNIMDYHFTAELENKLDLIADNKITKNNVLNEFYNEFKIELNLLDNDIKNFKNGNIVANIDNMDVILKNGKYGQYLVWNGKNYSFKDLDVNYDNIFNVIKGNNKNIIKYNNIDIEIKKGKYGLYFNYNNKNYSLKDYDENNINENIINDIINNDNNKIIKKIGKYDIINGPYGPYFKYNKKFISINNKNIDNLNEDDLKELINNFNNKKKYVKKNNFYNKKINN